MRATLRLTFRMLGLVFLFACVSHAAGVTGTVKGPDGAPFKGAFVQAQNAATKITVSVLSDKDGHYRVERLPAGEYQVQIKAPGYKADPHRGVKLTADQNLTLDWALQKGVVRWRDISLYQGEKLLPEGKGKQILAANCFICHEFQTRMASVTRDESGWRDRVEFMRTSMHFSLDRLKDPEANEMIAYLTSVFGPDSTLAKSPVDLPGYAATVRPMSDDAMKIVYVEYDMPGPDRNPFSAAPARDGSVWMPFFGDANKIGKLDPTTGKIEEYQVPNVGTAAIHSAVAGPDGNVWLAEQASNKLAKWDPKTQKFTEYQDAYRAGKEGILEGGAKHTVREDEKGFAWVSGGPFGNPLSRLDPETGKYTNFEGTEGTYGLALDKDGNCWFSQFTKDGQIGRVDAKTGKVTKWALPTTDGRPRRIQVDSDGMVWVAEYVAGKIARFDPKTETFKEWTLPGPEATPYGFGIDGDKNVWYSSFSMDTVGRLDPRTGQVTEYPFVHSENTIREFFTDAKGRIWYGTPANNKVGYFYVAGNN